MMTSLTCRARAKHHTNRGCAKSRLRRRALTTPSATKHVTCRFLDLSSDEDCTMVGALLNEYASDAMGGATPLEPDVVRTVGAKLNEVPGAMSVAAFDENCVPVGLCNSLMGFSTFKALPLCNIHDVYVKPSHRGCGIAPQMLKLIEEEARARGCCKLTLEVLSNNESAKKSYEKYGFQAYELDPEAGQALFWEKALR